MAKAGAAQSASYPPIPGVTLEKLSDQALQAEGNEHGHVTVRKVFGQPVPALGCQPELKAGKQAWLAFALQHLHGFPHFREVVFAGGMYRRWQSTPKAFQLGEAI